MTTVPAEDRMDRLFARYSGATGPGLAVAVVDRGEMVFARAYGSASLEHDIPITLESRFAIASITKTFVAALCVLFERQGKLSLDDPIRRYIPELPDAHDAPQPITLRHLLSMTSGLKDSVEMLRLAGYWWRGIATADDLIALVARQPLLNFRPGARFLYTNVNFILLARVLERIAGQGFAELLDTTILKSLGMTATCLRDDPGLVVRDLATGYIPTGDGTWTRGEWSFGLSGAGSLVSTVSDLIRWLWILRSGRLAGYDVVAEMRSPPVLEDGSSSRYGLGLSVHHYRGVSIIGHGGSLPGYRSVLAYMPELDLGVVALANRDDFDRDTALMGLVDLWCGDDPPAPQAAKPAAPEGIAGRYVEAEHGEVAAVAATDGGLEIDMLGARTVLVPDGAGGFVDQLGLAPMRLKVDTDSAGGRTLQLACGGWTGRMRPAASARGGVSRLAACLGRYRNAELETTLEVSLAGDRLRVRYGTPPHAAAQFLLTPLAEDVFLLAFDRPGYAFGHTLRFRRNAAGHVHEILITGARLKNVRFEREPG